ncbi:hypothetical protein Tco_0152552 [Tanacetum coccineum]
MSKVLQERGFGCLPRSTEANPRDQVKSISTTIEADSCLIRRIGSYQYDVSTGHSRTLMYEANNDEFRSNIKVGYAISNGSGYAVSNGSGYADILIRASRLKKVMANKGKKSSMETFAPNDKADYYSGITSITVNGKNAYELKGKLLDDLHNNAFSGTNGKDASNKEETAKIFKIETDVFDYVIPLCLAFNKFNYLLKVDPNLLTKDIMGFKTYEDYKDDWIYEWNENVPWVYDKPWLDNGVWKELKPVKHTFKPFNYKTGCSEWPTYSWRKDGYCNGGNLPGTYHIGNSLHYQDLEWYEALEDSELKDEALRNKAIMEGLISDDESSYQEQRQYMEDTLSKFMSESTKRHEENSNLIK